MSFNMDNIVMRALSRFFDIMCLNFFWLICSVPVITIGASTTALYTVMLKIVRNEEGYIARTYFKSFKENFKQSTIAWLIILAAFLIFLADMSICKHFPGDFYRILQSFFIGMCILVLLISQYVFPLIARYENTTFKLLKNAVLLSVAKLPYTLLMGIIAVVFGVSTFAAMWTAQSSVIAMFVWIFVGVALVAWINSKILVKIFDKLEEQK